MIEDILKIVAIKPNLTSSEICTFLKVNLEDIRTEFADLLKEGYLLQKKVRKPNKYGRTSLTPVYVLGTKRLNIESKSNSKIVPKETKKVFVSHAGKDRRLANKFIDEVLVLILGLNKEKDIFYTSDHITGIQPSEDWKETIRKNLYHSEIFIALISPRFKEREMCLAELGAAWVLNDKKVFQLAINPIKKSDCSFVLDSKQNISLTEKHDLKSFINTLNKSLYDFDLNEKLQDKNISKITASLSTINATIKNKIKATSPKKISIRELTVEKFKEQTLYKSFSLITSEKKNYKTIKTDFLKNDIGAFLVWIDYLGDDNLNASSYIVSHASNDGASISSNISKYENIWAIKRTINKKNRVKDWSFICSDSSCVINSIKSDRNLSKGKHLFTVSWNKPNQLISFYIDKVKVGESPFKLWPKNIESEMTIGTWQSKHPSHYFNSKIGNIKVLNGIEVSDHYLDREIKKFNK